MNTYTSGYDLFFTRNITKGDMVNICNDLTSRFNNGYIFEPEPMSDGFIYIKNQKYKCMRLSCFRTPLVLPNVMEEWKDSKDIFVSKTVEDNFKGKRKHYSSTRMGFNGQNYIGTFLKSFYDAPAWTIKELELIKDVLFEYDILTTNIKAVKLK